MYCPRHFQDDRPELLRQLVADHPLGTLVTLQDGALMADEIVFQLAAEEGAHGTLRAHVARANPLWQRAANTPVLVIFRGPQAYVSPSWYPAKAEHGKVVPTWNYVVMQARGVLRAIDDARWLRAQIEALTRSQEDHRTAPWHVGDAPANYIDQMASAIVGIEVSIETLSGKTKVSQNRAEADRAGVVAGLREEAGEQASAMADLVAKTLSIK